MEMSGYLFRCSAGESFDSIALSMYGKEEYAADIITANPKYAWTTVFQGGETLAMPLVDETAEETVSDAETAPWRR